MAATSELKESFPNLTRLAHIGLVSTAECERYSASIEKIDYDEEKVLIHYRQWSHRYDEWFDWDSPYLRPVERVQLRKEGLQAEEGDPEFKVNDKVFASWSDCRFYPARILAVNKDATYAVKFYDGVIQTVKSIHIKPYKKIGKCKIEDKIVEKSGGKKETVKDDIKHNGTDHTGSHGNIKSKEVSCNVQEKDQGIYRKEVVKKVCFKRASHENSKWAKLKAEMPINVKQESVEHPKRIRLASDEHSKKTRLFPDDHFKRVRRVSVQHFKKARQVSKKYSKRPWIVTEKHSKPILCTSKEHCKNHETISQEISKRPHYTSEENSKRTVQVLEKACNRTKPVSEKDPVKAKRALEEEADPVKAMRASEEEEEEDPIKARQTTEEKNPIRARQASEEKDSVRGRRSSEGKDPVRGRRCSVEKDTIRARQTTDGKDPVRVRQTTDEKDPVRVRRALEDKNPLRSRRLSGEISRKAKNTSREDPRRAERALRKEPERANRGEEPKRARRFRLEDPKRTRRVLRQGPKRTRRVLREGPKGNRRVLRKCPKGAKQVSRKDSKGVRRGSQKTAKGARQVSQKGAKGARQLSQQGLKETRRVLRDGPKGVRQASQEGLKRARQFTRKNTKVDRRETDTNYDNCNNEFETKRKRTTFKVVDDCKILYKDAGFISKIKPKVGKGYVIRKRGAGKVLSKNMQDLNKDSLNQKSEKKADKREQEAGLVLIKAATENDNGSEESNEGSKIDSKILKQENTANDEKIADAPNGIIKGNFKILDEKSNKKMAEENLSTEMVEVNIGKDLSNSQILAVNRELKREEMLQHGDARLPTVEHNANDCSISKAEIPLEILKEENRELTNDGCQQKIVKVEEVAKIMKEKVEGSNVEIRSQQQEPSQAREKKRRGRPPLKASQAQLMPEEVKNELPDLHQENADHLQVSVNELKQQENEEKPKESSNVLKKTEPVQVFTETLYSGIKRTQDVLSTPALAVDLDHNTFKCKVEDCLKSFRKAKLLHYHMKYYHGVDKANEIDQSPKRNIHTRASEKQAVQENHKRRRTISSSLLKEKEKFKEKKHRDFLRIKLKKKKKKKKKSKSEEDSLSNSSTDSLFWSEEEFSQEVDVTTNPDEDAPDEDDQCHEIVRCICEVQEENDFMIQCEECLCWQHGVCMGLLEHNVPERYTCYICRDPPGQRQSLKYWYDKEWLSSGHMYGLPFLEENYSHQNGKKIAATHQLLGDVQKVIEVLNGLQLKISILQSQAHPDLKLWCQSWKHIDCKDKPRKKQPPLVREENDDQERSMVCWSVEEVNVKPCIGPCIQESYITSEHCYQKPRTYYPAMEQRLVVETRGAELDDRTQIIRENVDDFLILDHGRYSRSMDQERSRRSCESYLETTSLQEMEGDVSKKSFSEEEFSLNLEDGEVQQQWQINLLDHIEAVQDEVTHRMDFIEKELDVLESWLDYTGELEPPEPLARLPQLKHRIKQLLTELGKIQEIALCCST
ncbi:PHF20 protein, partial [Polypterus senegalus]